MKDSSSRVVVRKSSPAPIARALESNTAPRALSPLRRAAGSLAVAAAMVLAAGGAAALAGCGDAAKPDADRSSRDDRPKGDTARRERADGSETPIEDLVRAVGDFVDPPNAKADDVRRTPVPPASDPPRPAGTGFAPVPTPTPPRLAGSTASPASPPPAPPPKTAVLR